MSRRANKRKSRGGYKLSICPGCGELLNETPSKHNPKVFKVETVSKYAVFCGTQDCLVAADQLVDRAPFQFEYRRTP